MVGGCFGGRVALLAGRGSLQALVQTLLEFPRDISNPPPPPSAGGCVTMLARGGY